MCGQLYGVNSCITDLFCVDIFFCVNKCVTVVYCVDSCMVLMTITVLY